MTRTRLLALLKSLSGPLLLLLMLRLVGGAALLDQLRLAEWRFLLVALLAYFGSTALRVLRWRTLLRAQGLEQPFPHLVALDLIGAFFNLLLPGSVGGDVAKFVALARDAEGNPNPHYQARVASSLVADRVAGIAVLLLMGLATLPLAGASLRALVALPLVLAAGAALLALAALSSPRLRRWLARWLHRWPRPAHFVASLDAYDVPTLRRTALFALLFNLLIVSVNLFLGRAFGVALPAPTYLVVAPLLSLAMALPLSINGMGVREGGYLLLLTPLGVTPPTALAMALGYYGCTVATGIVGGLIYMHRTLTARGVTSIATPPLVAEEIA